MKQRLIISEEERKEIINLHRKFINEAGPAGMDPNLQQGTQTQPTTQTQQGTQTQPTTTTARPQLGTNTTPEEKKLIDAAMSWVQTNQGSIPKTVAEITKFLNDQVTAKKLTPESLPYIKGVIQSNSNGTLVFPPEEVGGTAAPTTTTTTTTASTQSVAIQRGVKNPKVETLQNKLNEKFKSGLVVDGKWGPKTAAAVKAALDSLNVQTGDTVKAPTNVA